MHILWFSDFLHLSANDSFWTKGVRGLQSKHQLQLIEISDELEKKSSPGLWRDSETGALAIGRGSSSKSTLATGRFAADKVRNLWTAYTSEDLVEIFRRYMLKSTRIEGGPGGQ
jgi:hypothetical protein